jgi:hypothetical protein
MILLMSEDSWSGRILCLFTGIRVWRLLWSCWWVGNHDLAGFYVWLCYVSQRSTISFHSAWGNHTTGMDKNINFMVIMVFCIKLMFMKNEFHFQKYLIVWSTMLHACRLRNHPVHGFNETSLTSRWTYFFFFCNFDKCYSNSYVYLLPMNLHPHKQVKFLLPTSIDPHEFRWFHSTLWSTVAPKNYNYSIYTCKLIFCL